MENKIKHIVLLLFLLFLAFAVKSQTATATLLTFTKTKEWKETTYTLKSKELNAKINFYIHKKPNETIQLVTLLQKLAIQNLDSITEVDALKYLGNCYFFSNKKIMAILQYTKSQRKAKEISYKKGESAAFHNIALVYFHSNKYEKSITNFRSALRIDSVINNEVGIAESLIGLGVIYEKQKKYTQSISYLQKGLSIGKLLNDSVIMINSLHDLGETFKSKNEFKKSLYYFTKANEYFKSNSFTIPRIQNNYSIGEVYEKTYRFNKALTMYKLVIRQSKKINFEKGEAMALNSIGNIYKNQKQFNKALTNYNYSLQIMKQIGDNTGVAIASDNIGNIYEQAHDFEKALKFYQIALSIKAEMNDINAITVSKSNIGMLYFRMKDIKKATEFLLYAYEMNKLSKNEIEIANNAKNLAIIHAQERNYAKAELYLQECIEIAKRKNLLQLQKSSYGLLSNIYAQTGKYRKAFEYNSLVIIMKDSIFSIETQKQLDDIKTKYETDKKNQENIILKKDNELNKETILRQKIISFSVSGFLLLTVIIAFLFFRSRQRQKQLNKDLNKQKKVIEKQAGTLSEQNEQLIELDKFKSNLTNMIVHDLKNPLNAIGSLSKNSTVKHSAKKMYNLINNMLDVNKFEEAKMNLNLEKFALVEITKSALEQVEYITDQKGLIIKNNCSQSIVLKGDKDMLERVLVNLLNNAAKFTQNNGTIWLETQKQVNSSIKVMVRDNGVGISKENIAAIFDKYSHTNKKTEIKSTGLGLTFCKMAIESHNGKIGVESWENKGTSFWFTLPFAEESFAEKKDKNTELEKSNYLNTKEIELLKPYAEKLKTLELFEASLIREELLKLNEFESEAIKKWTTEYENAIYYGNEEKISQLLRLSIDD